MVETAVVEAACGACGYDLRGIGSDRCPECGRWFDVTGQLTSRLPGRRRGWLGGVRRYAATAWRVSRRPGRLGDELDRMVDAEAGRRFRWVTVLMAWVGLGSALFAVRWMWYAAHDGWSRGNAVGRFAWELDGLLVWGWSYWVSVAALGLVLAWGTLAAGWLAHSRRLDDVRANRAAGLAPYTCAPLAWMPLAGLVAVAVWATLAKQQGRVAFARWEWGVYVGAAPALVVLAWGWCVVALARRARGLGAVGTMGVAVALAAIWLTIAAAVFLGAHAVTALAVLVGRSWA